MYRSYLIPFLTLFWTITAHGQINLVRNPSFEIHDSCAIGPDEITFAYGWTSLDSAWRAPDWAHDLPGVPELCNACAGYYSTYAGVPASATYFHYPRTGNSMAQVQMFYNEFMPTNYERDYLQSRLSSRLTAGRPYCVTFHILQEFSVYAVNKIGAYFDDGTIDTTHNPGLIQTQVTPQVLDTAIVADTINWTEVQGNFMANGTEKYITIGNFTDTAHINFVLMPGLVTSPGPAYSWYLVDDVSIFPSDATINAGPDRVVTSGGIDSVIIGDTLDSYLPTTWYVNGIAIDSNKAWIKVHPDTTTTYVLALNKCGGEVSYDTVVVWVATTLLQAEQLASAQIFPNPTSDELTVEHAPGAAITIYDVFGKKVYTSRVQSDNEIIDLRRLTPNVYFVTLEDLTSGARKSLKILKQ